MHNPWTWNDGIPRTLEPEPPAAAFVHETIDGVELIHVFGEIDLANAHELETAIAKYLTSGSPSVLDLTACTYIDSTGLRVIAKASLADPVTLKIVIPAGGGVRRVFEVTGLIPSLPVYKDVDDAVLASL